MSEMPGLPGLEPYYPWADANFPLPNGKQRSKRGKQLIAKRHNLPVVYVGWCAFIDPALAAERLREAQLSDRTPRGRGRPPKAA
jgi:hypothetical protein